MNNSSFSIEDTKALFMQDAESDIDIDMQIDIQSDMQNDMKSHIESDQIQNTAGNDLSHTPHEMSSQVIHHDTDLNHPVHQPEQVTNISDLTTPTTVIDTSKASTEPYVPMLPKPVSTDQKRQLILDTETTGLEAHNGDRIIEIGVVEVINRRFTGEKLHVYLDPERGMDPEAVAVHGITPEFLAGKPKFAEVAKQVLDFLKGGEIIAHNAPFDIGFLHAEFSRVGVKQFESMVSVTDSLAVAKTKYPGQKNSLDALVKRLDIITKDRTFHGALLDAEILADVYLTMTGGQVTLSLGENAANLGKHKTFSQAASIFIHASALQQEQNSHDDWIKSMSDKSDAFVERWQNL